MKKLGLLTAVAALALFAFSTPAMALPTLQQYEPTKMKFTNYERWALEGGAKGDQSDSDSANWTYSAGDKNRNGILDAGDVIEGVLNVTTITDIPEVDTTWVDGAGGDELTGTFQFTVTAGSMLDAGGISFGLGGAGDHFRLFYDTVDDYDPTQADAWARASGGMLYAEVLGADLIEAGAKDLTPGNTQTQWWFDLTTNNTGYNIIPQLWPEMANGPGTGPHLTPTGWHPAGHTSEIYLEGSLYGSTLANWDWRSEDPAYLYAVPEPSTIILLGSGLLGAGIYSWRRKKKS